MSREVAVADLHAELESLTYPVTREEAMVAFDDVVVQYGEGKEAFDTVLSQTTEEVFVSPQDLEAEVYEHLPEHATDPPDVEEVENGEG
jgi:hypothetical protein